MSRSYRRAISILLGIIVVLLAAWFFLFSAIRDASDRLGKLELDVAAKVKEQEDRVLVKRLLEQTEADRLKLVSYFVTEATAVNFIEQIETIGQQVGASVEVNSAVAGEKGMGFSIRATGSFKAVYRFVELLEVIPYALTLDRVTLVQTQNEAKTPSVWQADLAFTLLTPLDKANNE